MLKYVEVALSPLEVPQEMALCIYISACPHRCKECHYPELQMPDYGEILADHYVNIVDLYLSQATCVCFLGEGRCGSEERAEFQKFVAYAKEKGLKTCLYSGRDVEIEPWMQSFDYLKLGSYRPFRGPLTSHSTNQRMFRKEGDKFRDITAVFWQQ